jgi:hypothetical protein
MLRSRLVLGVVSVLAVSTATHAGSLKTEEPLFSRHIVPLFSRLGCNSGSCHGAVQGQNGFRLSLFGVDPAQDRENLLRDSGGRRLDLHNPARSLFLLKALGQVPHEGGIRVRPQGWEYAMLQRWVSRGAPLDDLSKSRVVKLKVTRPASTLKPGIFVDLRVEASFADGSTEDVTKFCTFEVQDREVARAEDSKVEALQPGLSAVVVRYGAEPALAMITVPRPDAAAFPSVKGNNFIDEHILGQLKRLNIPPSDLCDDATFLRRASLDVTGSLPTPQEVRSFLADKDSAKRTKKIDELLGRAGYSALWATKFCDLLKLSGFDANFALNEAAETKRFYDWIRARLQENVPYDQFVERILTATSREGRSQEEWIKEVDAMAAENARSAPGLALYTERKTLDLYWQRKEATGIKGTLQAAHAFLGLRLECAQCHRHPHDVWKQDDLLSFANFFIRVKGAGYPDSKSLNPKAAERLKKAPVEAKELRAQVKKLQDQMKALKDKKAPEMEIEHCKEEVARLEMKARAIESGPKRYGTEVYHQSSKSGFASVTSPLGTQKSDRFRLLGEAREIKPAAGDDPRKLVMDWLRRPDNPYFARAIVNRVWAHYFTRGIVDPPDHLSPLNPPSHPELLEALAKGFVENKYDLKWLHRTILLSRTYQASSQPNEANKGDRRNFAYYYLRRPMTEVFIDAINQVTGAKEKFPARLFLPEGTRALEVPGPIRVETDMASLAFAYQSLGRPARNPQTLCDCERESNATMVAALFVGNHPQIHQKIKAADGRLAQVMKELNTDEQRIDEVFLMTLSRFPTMAERQMVLRHLEGSASKQLAMEDLAWVLLNSKEFMLNH